MLIVADIHNVVEYKKKIICGNIFLLPLCASDKKILNYVRKNKRRPAKAA